MSDNDATRRRHRVADPLREYADNLANGRVADYEPSIIAQFIHAHANEIDREHDHEIEQLRRLRFREGYEAGQRSMDAEHYAVALRLKHLPLDEDSHGNLNQIARAIWHSDFGWTKGACEALRDELVRLMGGAHDEPAQTDAGGCACDADCDCGHQQPQAVAYDVLGNERHKAVCRLRKFEPMIGSKPTEEASKLIRCITGKSDSHVACGNDLEETRDRLIHLLGGDECNFSVGKNYMDDMGEKSNPAETSDTITGHVILDTPLPNFSEPNLPKSAEIVKPESDDGGENCRITDELRKFKGRVNAGLTPETVLALRAEINCIADRIDEQAKRDRESDQLRIEKLVEERDKLKKKLDGARGVNRHITRQWDISNKKRRELQKKLDTIREALDG